MIISITGKIFEFFAYYKELIGISLEINIKIGQQGLISLLKNKKLFLSIKNKHNF